MMRRPTATVIAMQHPDLPSLLQTKLYPGTTTRQTLQRPRLDPPQAVISGGCTVVSIVAPAGYGKSTLMASWYANWPHECRGWLNLDDDDNDPLRLLRYLVGAFQSAEPDMGGDAFGQLAGEGYSSPTAVLESLAIDAVRHRVGALGELAISMMTHRNYCETASLVTVPAPDRRDTDVRCEATGIERRLLRPQQRNVGVQHLHPLDVRRSIVWNHHRRNAPPRHMTCRV